MKTRLLAMLYVCVGASSASAQLYHGRTLRLGLRVPVGESRATTPLCDGSAVRAVKQRRNLGKMLEYGGAAIGLIGAYATSSGRTGAIPLIPVGFASGLGGYYLASHANLDPQFWDATLANARAGVTRSEDVRACLGQPTSLSTSASQQTWSYSSANIDWFGASSSHAVTFVFNGGVLASIRRDDSNFGR